MNSHSHLTPQIVSAISEVPKVLHPELERAWESFLSHSGSFALAGRIRETTRVWAASPFAAGICCRDPEVLVQLLDSGDLDRSYQPSALDERITKALSAADSENDVMQGLRQLRRAQMLRIAWRDLVGTADLNETLQDLSCLAQACVEYALSWCFKAACRRYGIPRGQTGEAQRLVVLGMGKLGGYELNFSSDIDLIFSFPEEGVTDSARGRSNSQFFIRLAQRLIKLLNDTTADGFVFRLDMRLRPFGDSGPLVVSFDAMEDYYQQHGRSWERYAMIKARVVAGGKEAGAQLLSQLRPFVYRRYLDFGAFEALRKMKGLINTEIKRRNLDDNVKLGAGGIREIEFIGQAFQLIRGGRDPDLQERRIQVVLKLLENKELLPAYAVDKLLKAYEFLRRVENRLQMVADQQTHMLPDEDIHRVRLAFAMGYSDWGTFKDDLDRHRQQVRDLFEGLFATPQFDGSSTSEENESGTPLLKLWHGVLDKEPAVALLAQVGYRQPSTAYEVLAKHREGRVYHLKNVAGRERLDRLMPLLIAAVGQSSDPDTVLPRLLSLIDAIVKRSVYIALLAEHPMALSQLVQLSAASPWISEYLRRYPILLDGLLDPRTLYAPPDKDGLREQLEVELRYIDGDDLETLMDRLRYFKQANVLRVAAADVMDHLPLMKVSDQLTWIAEVILDKVSQICIRTMVAKHGAPRCIIEGEAYQPGFAIAAYGKLGGIELGYASDLDIVFLHDSAGKQQYTDGSRSIDNSVFYARLGQRIIHFLTAFTSAGELYEIDSRLRPSGVSGPLVSSLQAFESYQLEKAWTWEHQALARARVVAGDMGIARRFDQIRCAVLNRPRDNMKLRLEVREMRRKMWEGLARTPGGHFDVKKDHGGIADIEFMVQYGVLAHTHGYPSLTEFTDNIRLLDTLERCKLMPAEDAQSLRDIYRLFRDKVHSLSLQGEDSVVDVAEFVQERARVKQLWREIMEA
ncbi:MAG: bifunctional [glutamate--ammonia ligase]-adenylyl-L-tyrosine phosphorylase/[glutamate--ammonia-ligase] adenylyltransferase [Gammaproteobacteria bacterium]|nr:bifunctional [glutamate--ammonia ligase]-adenylyl-L-tyrosine phosphorylase/[glutamate--ammonia-ligase] adenylyltransferase [Gammaproteobacteria bacterium]